MLAALEIMPYLLLADVQTQMNALSAYSNAYSFQNVEKRVFLFCMLVLSVKALLGKI